MPTVIIRPSSTTSQTGWVADPIGTAADNNTSTGVVQNNSTCNWTAVLADLDSGLSGATINSFTISANAKAGRAGACNAWLSLVHNSDGAFAAEVEAWTGTQGTRTTTARTTQQDGSSALTYAYINDCSVKIDPNNQGMTLYELFVTVDYTPGGYGNDVIGVASANIGKVNGVATADIDKVIGV
tara:strand:- start:11822 stop:12373 length:552 start_codon:yes stop_codon:yes gene_type:complete